RHGFLHGGWLPFLGLKVCNRILSKPSPPPSSQLQPSGGYPPRPRARSPRDNPTPATPDCAVRHAALLSAYGHSPCLPSLYNPPNEQNVRQRNWHFLCLPPVRSRVCLKLKSQNQPDIGCGNS